MEMQESFNKVLFNGNQLDVPTGTSVEDARAGLKAIYPEIGDADHSIEDGVLTFTLRANSKG